MCGILGCVGHDNVGRVILKGLETQLYRGYDSIGVATLEDGRIDLKKSVISDDQRDFRLDKVDNTSKFSNMTGTVGIGHTRWATHGNVENKNAHPHLSCDEAVAVVHNGIIENYKDIRSSLERSGHVFRSETDTEVVPHLIEDFYKKESLERAAFDSMKYIEGDFALGIIGNRDPYKIVVTKRERPMVIGIGKGGNVVSSDIYGVSPWSDRAIILDDNEIGVVTPGGITVYDNNFKKIEKSAFLIDDIISSHERKVLSSYSYQKGGYMEAEILGQPETMLNTIDKIDKKSLEKASEMIADADYVYNGGAGSSYNSSLLLKILGAKFAGRRMENMIGAEGVDQSLIDNGTILVAMSQSGETADLISMINYAKSNGAKVIAITNKPFSSIEKKADIYLRLNCGEEKGVAATKTFESQLAVSTMIAAQIAGYRNGNKKDELMSALSETPGKVNKVIKDNYDGIKRLASDVAKRNAVYFIGRRENEITAREGALKLKEVSYIHSEAHNAGELKHGPLAIISSDGPGSGDTIYGTPVIVSIPNTNSSIYKPTMNNVMEAKTRGAYMIGYVDENDLTTVDYMNRTFKVPASHPYLRPMIDTPLNQMLALHTSLKLGYNPDMPRNLAKSVTVK